MTTEKEVEEQSTRCREHRRVVYQDSHRGRTGRLHAGPRVASPFARTAMPSGRTSRRTSIAN